MAFALASISRNKKAAPTVRAARRGPARTPLAIPALPEGGAFVSGTARGARPTTPTLQTQLEVGEPDDRFEREADRVAEEVVRMPTAPATVSTAAYSADRPPRSVQRLCSACEEELHRQAGENEEEEELLQTKAAGGVGPMLTPGIASWIGTAMTGSGQPLPASVRTYFEPRFGHDFTRVRIHKGAAAFRSARLINAQAYTLGQHIVFGEGQYAPETSAGRKLLAHELTHVVQQRGGATPTLQRQQIQPTCNGIAYNPEQQCCCGYRVLPGPCAAGSKSCAHPTTRDNEYDGCSVPAWLEDPAFKDNPGLAADTWFSDRKIHGTQIQDSFDPKLPCDVHDKCYQTCSSSPQTAWEACDQQLFIDAEAVCEKHKAAHGEDYNYALCTDAVLKAKALLPRGSWGSFEERQREYCACCPPPAVHDDTAVYFDTNSADLDATAHTDLTLFVQRHRALLKSGAFNLTLIGYASRLGSDEDNLKLSKRRIAAVRAGIERLLGAPLSQVHEKEIGEEEANKEKRPQEDDSPKDRRVEIIIVGHT